MTSQVRRLSAVGRLEKVRGILSEYASMVIPARSRKQTAMPPSLWEPSQENQMEDSESDPEDDQRQEKTIGAVAGDILRPNHSNGQDERNRQQTNTRQPIQPLPRCEALIHCTPAPLSWHTGIPEFWQEKRRTVCLYCPLQQNNAVRAKIY